MTAKNMLAVWIKSFSAANRFYIITALIIIVLLVECANFWFVTKTMSGIRVFISTQEEWSLAQKDITIIF